VDPNDEWTPVIVGVGQWTNKGPPHLDNIAMAAKSANLALQDATGEVGFLHSTLGECMMAS